MSSPSDPELDRYLDALIEQFESDKNNVLVLLAFSVAVLGYATDKILETSSLFSRWQWWLAGAAVGALTVAAVAFFWWFRFSHKERLSMTKAYLPEHRDLVLDLVRKHTTERTVWMSRRWIWRSGVLLMFLGIFVLVALLISVAAGMETHNAVR
jgi:hypothetical protein